MRTCSDCKVSKPGECYLAKTDPRCVACTGIASRKVKYDKKGRVPLRGVEKMPHRYRRVKGSDTVVTRQVPLEEWHQILKDLEELSHHVIGL